MTKFALTAILHILDLVTPEIVGVLKDSVKNLAAAASHTDNPWDDVLTNFLMAILGIPTKDI